LPTNIGLGYKGSSGTHTLANYENPQITAVMSFKVHALGKDYYIYDWKFQSVANVIFKSSALAYPPLLLAMMN